MLSSCLWSCRMIIFDFDLTLVNSEPLEHLRMHGKWSAVMARISEIEAYSGIEELLFDLHERNQILAIVTKSPSMVPSKFIELNNWPIGIVIGYHQVKRGQHKPKPDALHKAMQKAGVADEKSFHVGDKPEDTQAARAAKVTAIGAGWGLDDTRDLEASAPDYLFTTVSQIRDFFEQVL